MSFIMRNFLNFLKPFLAVLTRPKEQEISEFGIKILDEGVSPTVE
jgi:hypothetical protein